MAFVLAGMVGGGACHKAADGTTSVANGTVATQTQAAPSRPAPGKSLPKPECFACAMEDLRQAAHKDQVVVTARYLGLKARWSGERRTTHRCTRDLDVVGVVRFALIGKNPWYPELSRSGKRGDLVDLIEAELPCPELSRPQYANLSHYDPDDTERDGLGHAPVLRQGQVYRLTFAKSTGGVIKDTLPPRNKELVLTLVAVNPL